MPWNLNTYPPGVSNGSIGQPTLPPPWVISPAGVNAGALGIPEPSGRSLPVLGVAGGVCGQPAAAGPVSVLGVTSEAVGAPFLSAYAGPVSAQAGAVFGFSIVGDLRPVGFSEGAFGQPRVVGPMFAESAYEGSAFGSPRLTVEVVSSTLPKGFVQ